MLSRFLNLVLALSAIILLSPTLLIIWVAIRLTNKGPAIFKQERAGQNGKSFLFYKFRTMKTAADPFGASPKNANDPRITKIGKLLRETSLDELPQLFNVLKNDMHLVGPRPLYISQMQEWNEHQKKRLLVKPGITGLAQISGRGQLTIEDKLNLDVKYVESACWVLDLKIILNTILQIFRKQDIYEKNYSKTQETRQSDNQ